MDGVVSLDHAPILTRWGWRFNTYSPQATIQRIAPDDCPAVATHKLWKYGFSCLDRFGRPGVRLDAFTCHHGTPFILPDYLKRPARRERSEPIDLFTLAGIEIPA